MWKMVLALIFFAFVYMLPVVQIPPTYYSPTLDISKSAEAFVVSLQPTKTVQSLRCSSHCPCGGLLFEHP